MEGGKDGGKEKGGQCEGRVKMKVRRIRQTAGRGESN